MARKTAQRPKRAAALPPIPTDTPEGIRVNAIAEAFNVFVEPKQYKLQLQPGELNEMAKALRVPPLFLGLLNGLADTDDEGVQEYVAWRHWLAGEAVA